PELAAALAEHREMIAGEVLAVSFGPGEGAADTGVAAGPWHEHSDAGLGLRFWLAVAPAA
ncbi:MAG TPA: hypothetical protein VKV38_00180, partial [Trebonia sp.]|nr:hypothetical protein [Trebonia sp.]